MGTKTASGRSLLARLLKQDRRLTLPLGATEYPGAEALTTAARIADNPLTSAGLSAAVGIGTGAAAGLAAGPALGVGAAGAGIYGGIQMLARAMYNRHMAGRINKALNIGVSPTALMGNAQTRNYNRIATILRDEARLNDTRGLVERLAPAAKVVGTGVGAGAGGTALLRLMSGKESTASVKSASPLFGPALDIPASLPVRSLDAALPQYPVSKFIGSRLTPTVASGVLGLVAGPVGAAGAAAQSGLLWHVGRGASERAVAGRMRKALMDGLPTDAYLTGNQRRVHRAVQTAEALSASAGLSKRKAALLAALGLGAGAGAAGLIGGSEKTAETYNQRYGRRTDAWLGTKRPEGPSSIGAAFNSISNAFKPSPAAPKTSTKPKVMKFTEREVGTIGGPTGPNMSMPRPAPKPAPAPSKNMSMPRPAPNSSEEPRVGPTTQHVNFSRGDTVTARPPKIVPGKPIFNEGIREVNFSRKNPVNIDNPFGKRLPRVAKKKVLQLDGYGKVDLSGGSKRTVGGRPTLGLGSLGGAFETATTRNKSHLAPPKDRVASK